MPRPTNGIPKRRYHFHWPFLVYILITLLIAVGAFQGQNNLLIWLFGICIGLILVSGAISGTMMMGIRIERQRIVPCHSGEALEIRYAVTNRNRFTPLMALTITEVMENGKEKPADHPGVSVRKAALAAAPTGFLSHAPGRAVTTATSLAWTRDWGELNLSGVQITTSFPFGIIRKSLFFPDRASVIISPQKQETTPQIGLEGRGSQADPDASPLSGGQGDEFFGIREYVPGDTPRSIAWRRSAAVGKLLVKQWAGASPGRVFIGLRIDPRVSVEQADAALATAAGAVQAASDRRASVGLLIPWAGVDRPARPGRAHAAMLVDALSLIRLEPLKVPMLRPGALSPGRVSTGDTVLIVHAGEVDTRVGPRGTLHVQVDDLGRIISGPVHKRPKQEAGA